MSVTCPCGSTLKDKKGLKKHQRLHCKVVKPETTEANLPGHAKLIKPNELHSPEIQNTMPVTCPCGSTLKDKKGLKKHQRLHCKVVKQETTETNLHGHAKLIKPNELHSPEIQNTMPVTCPCGSTLKDKKGLKKHQLFHCKVVKPETTQANLPGHGKLIKPKELHSLKKQNTMPVTCPCGSILQDEKGLKKHQRLHCKVVKPETTEANLPCPNCDRMFPKLQSLNQHRRHVHSQQYNKHLQLQASSTRTHAQWTIYDDQKLAKLELELRSRPGIISGSAILIIAEKLQRTVESIKLRRKLLSYKKVVAELEDNSSEEDEEFDATLDDVDLLEPVTSISQSSAKVELDYDDSRRKLRNHKKLVAELEDNSFEEDEEFDATLDDVDLLEPETSISQSPAKVELDYEDSRRKLRNRKKLVAKLEDNSSEKDEDFDATATSICQSSVDEELDSEDSSEEWDDQKSLVKQKDPIRHHLICLHKSDPKYSEILDILKGGSPDALITKLLSEIILKDKRINLIKQSKTSVTTSDKIYVPIDAKTIKNTQKSFKNNLKKLDPFILEILLNIILYTGYTAPLKSDDISLGILEILNQILIERINSISSLQDQLTNTKTLKKLIKHHRSRASPYNIITIGLDTIFDRAVIQNTPNLLNQAGINIRVVEIFEEIKNDYIDYISIFKGLIINKLLASIDHQAGLELGKETIAALADEDSIYVLGPSKLATQSTLDHICAFLRRRYLTVRVKSCAALSTMRVPKKKKLFYVTDPIFVMDKQIVKQITSAEEFKCLGYFSDEESCDD